MEDQKTTEGQPQVGSDAWFALLPNSADGVPIMLGATVYAENWDRSFFGDVPFLTIKVESLHLGKSFDEYEGAFTVSGSDWEGGNLDCYADSSKVPNAWANVQSEATTPEPHPNHNKTMTPESMPESPQPVAEAESLVGAASTDLLADLKRSLDSAVREYENAITSTPTNADEIRRAVDKCADRRQKFNAAFIDDKPITSEWLREMGFLPVPSDLGPQYRDHMEKDGLNIWEFNDSGEWLFNDYDSISMKTRGRLRMIAHLTGTHLPNASAELPPPSGSASTQGAGGG